MARILICHLPQDASVARELGAALMGRGHTISFDGEPDSVREDRYPRLRHFETVAVIWTEASVTSAGLTEMAREALTHNLLAPLLAEDLDIRRLPIIFRKLNVFRTRDVDGIARFIARLAAAVSIRREIKASPAVPEPPRTVSSAPAKRVVPSPIRGAVSTPQRTAPPEAPPSQLRKAVAPPPKPEPSEPVSSVPVPFAVPLSSRPVAPEPPPRNDIPQQAKPRRMVSVAAFLPDVGEETAPSDVERVLEAGGGAIPSERLVEERQPARSVANASRDENIAAEVPAARSAASASPFDNLVAEGVAARSEPNSSAFERLVADSPPARPAARPRAPASLLGDVLAIKAEQLLYFIPEEMFAGEPDRVVVRLGSAAMLDLVRSASGHSGTPHGGALHGEVPVVQTLSLSLHSHARVFEIGRRSETTQFVATGGLAGSPHERDGSGHWEWIVTPWETGEHSLFVRISAVLRDSRGVPYTTALSDREFPVFVSSPRREIPGWGRLKGLLQSWGVLG